MPDGDELVCEGHRFRFVTHGDKTARDWNMVLTIPEILPPRVDAERLLDLERRAHAP